MYCKYCGKEIAEDAAFCQYCGGNLQGQQKGKVNVSLLTRFQSLSKGWQIAIMVYIVWFFAGMCFLIGMAPYGRRGDYEFSEVFWPVFLAVVGVPIVVLFVWYYFARLRKPKVNDVQENERDLASSSTKSGFGVKMVSYPLMDFAIQHGKMQVKTVANPTTNEVHSYCAFIGKQGVEINVEFGQSLGVLRPQEIVERKEQLMVVQRVDGTFELVEK